MSRSVQRALLAAVLLLAGFGAEAAPPRGHVSAPVAEELPVPPLPPAEAATEPSFAPAPIPNLDVQQPRVGDNQPRTEVVPTFHAQQNHASGHGYVMGSEARYDLERRIHAAPGLNLQVPLE